MPPKNDGFDSFDVFDLIIKPSPKSKISPGHSRRAFRWLWYLSRHIDNICFSIEQFKISFNSQVDVKYPKNLIKQIKQCTTSAIIYHLTLYLEHGGQHNNLILLNPKHRTLERLRSYGDTKDVEIDLVLENISMLLTNMMPSDKKWIYIPPFEYCKIEKIADTELCQVFSTLCTHMKLKFTNRTFTEIVDKFLKLSPELLKKLFQNYLNQINYNVPIYYPRLAIFDLVHGYYFSRDEYNVIKKLSEGNMSPKNVSNYPQIYEVLKKDEIEIKHVFSNLITLNGHGLRIDEKIVVPNGIQVLIPNQKGTDETYTTPSSVGGWISKSGNPNILTSGEGFEKPLYGGGYLNYLGVSPIGSGIEDPNNKRGIPWKLYVAGDTVNNMVYSPFNSGKDACSVGINYKSKIPLQREMIKQSNIHLKNMSFSVTLVPIHKNNDKVGKYTSEDAGLVKFQGKFKPIIKTCPRNGKNKFTLKDIFNNLLDHVNKLPENIKKQITPFDKPINNNNPLILIPFTCNASTPPNPRNNFDGDNKTPLNDYYQRLLKLSKK